MKYQIELRPILRDFSIELYEIITKDGTFKKAKVRKILRALDSAVQDAVCGDPIVCRQQRIRPKL